MPFLLIHNNVPDSRVVCHAMGGITLGQPRFNHEWRIFLIPWDLIIKLLMVACNIAVDRFIFL